jgi:hypothetical protein
MTTTARGVYERLVAMNVNSGSKIYHRIAPDDTAYPYILYSRVGSAYDHADARGIERDRWQVKAVSDDEVEAAGLQNNIRRALNYRYVEPSEGQHHIATRVVSNFDLHEVTDEDEVIFHAGCDFIIMSFSDRQQES